MADNSDDKPTRMFASGARKPRDAYGDPDGVTRKMGSPAAAPADEATAFVGRKRAAKPGAAGERADASPVAGWLVVMEGPGKGRSLEIYEGRNLVGRGDDCEVKLDFGDAAISRDYSLVIRYTPSARRFKVAPNLAVKNAPQLNDMELDEGADLRAGDTIKVGATKLKFVPFCGEGFDWADLDAKPV